MCSLSADFGVKFGCRNENFEKTTAKIRLFDHKTVLRVSDCLKLTDAFMDQNFISAESVKIPENSRNFIDENLKFKPKPSHENANLIFNTPSNM